MPNAETSRQQPATAAQPTPAATSQPQQPSLVPPEAQGKTMEAKNLDLLLDIPMTVSVQIGSTTMLVRDLLQLGQGSVIELEKLAGEPMDVLVNQKLVARGEVVVVNEKFGIRLTDVVSPAERVHHLQ